MSLKDSEMHLFAGFGSPLVIVAVVALSMVTEKGCGSGGAKEDDDSKEIIIEASLGAYKPDVVQPQKPRPPPDPTEKPEGVSSDANKKPDKKKDDKKPDDKPIDIGKYYHPHDDDSAGPPSPATIGDLSGSINGDSATSKGDPYFGRLKADMSFSPPEIAQGNSVPIGCILLQADGKIPDVRMKVETHDDLQTAAETALARLKKLRNEHPEEVPPHLLKFAGQYICFHFTVTP